MDAAFYHFVLERPTSNKKALVTGVQETATGNYHGPQHTYARYRWLSKCLVT